MKRNIFLSLILLLLLLPACGEDSVQVRGLVTEVQTGPDGVLTAFVIQTEDKGRVGVLLTGDTFAAPSGSGTWTGSEMRAEFQAELLPDVSVSAVCLPAKKTLTTQDGQEIAAYEADHVSINGRLNRGAAALADGTALDVLEDNNPIADRTYLLPGGAKLLWVRGPSGPEHCYVGGLESFDDLSAQAREKVSAWYEDRGPLFDEAAELEKAYSDWKAKGEDFQSHTIDQGVSPSASSEKVMYFLTTVTLPYYGEGSATVYSLRLCDAFDREAGEHIDTRDLFTCPWEQVVQAILDGDPTLDAALRAEMEAVLTPERVEIFSDSVSVNFAPDTLPGHTPGWGYSLSAQVTDLMYPWAAPKARS